MQTSTVAIMPLAGAISATQKWTLQASAILLYMRSCIDLGDRVLVRCKIAAPNRLRHQVDKRVPYNSSAVIRRCYVQQ